VDEGGRRCELCEAARLTEWYHEDELCWIAECEACSVPMVVWKVHDPDPPEEVRAELLARLGAVLTERGADPWYVDERLRSIPDHYHAHARPRRPRSWSTLVSIAVVLLGIGLVWARDAAVPAPTLAEAPPVASLPTPVVVVPTPTTAPVAAPAITPGTAGPGTTAPGTSAPGTTAPTDARPVCRTVVHLGDSNLAVADEGFAAAYAAAGIPAVIDAANGRSAWEAADGGTPALVAIAEHRAGVPADGRCWVIALGTEDAALSASRGTEPRLAIEAIADAIGDEPILWVTPALAARDVYTPEAGLAFNTALAAVATERPTIGIVDWQTIALAQLVEYQPDGVHYRGPLYVQLVDTVLGAIAAAWTFPV
jgi:hypothetical protein